MGRRGTWLRATDDEFISRVRADYERYVTTVLDAGARCVAWIRPPTSALRSADGRLELEESFADGSQEAIGSRRRRNWQLSTRTG